MFLILSNRPSGIFVCPTSSFSCWIQAHLFMHSSLHTIANKVPVTQPKAQCKKRVSCRQELGSMSFQFILTSKITTFFYRFRTSRSLRHNHIKGWVREWEQCNISKVWWQYCRSSGLSTNKPQIFDWTKASSHTIQM